MAVKYVMKVWLFTECKRLLIKFWWVSLALTAKFGAIKPTILRWTSTIFLLTVIYSSTWSFWMCVRDVWEGKRERMIILQRLLSISKRKPGYTEPHTYLCLHLFPSLLIPGLLLCIAPAAQYLSFSLPCFLFCCLFLLIWLPLFLSAQMPQADWQHIKWNKAGAAVSDRS